MEDFFQISVDFSEKLDFNCTQDKRYECSFRWHFIALHISSMTCQLAHQDKPSKLELIFIFSQTPVVLFLFRRPGSYSFRFVAIFWNCSELKIKWYMLFWVSLIPNKHYIVLICNTYICCVIFDPIGQIYDVTNSWKLFLEISKPQYFFQFEL